mmetsp:Transcript_29849/g.34916  ORF Transcript_29849/g.34916 Transcript_29849/m.34916 type:complete len:103 (+) Transcript_29849:149-457(+)
MKLSKQCWSLDPCQSIYRAKPRNASGRKSFFTAEETEQMKILDRRYGKARIFQLDETGQVVSLEQEQILKKVREIMVKAGLVPSDKQLQEEAESDKLTPINT